MGVAGTRRTARAARGWRLSLLLDTHILLWLALGSEQGSRGRRAAGQAGWAASALHLPDRPPARSTEGTATRPARSAYRCESARRLVGSAAAEAAFEVGVGHLQDDGPAVRAGVGLLGGE